MRLNVPPCSEFEPNLQIADILVDLHRLLCNVPASNCCYSRPPAEKLLHIPVKEEQKKLFPHLCFFFSSCQRELTRELFHHLSHFLVMPPSLSRQGKSQWENIEPDNTILTVMVWWGVSDITDDCSESGKSDLLQTRCGAKSSLDDSFEFLLKAKWTVMMQTSKRGTSSFHSLIMIKLLH